MSIEEIEQVDESEFNDGLFDHGSVATPPTTPCSGAQPCCSSSTGVVSAASPPCPSAATRR
ncbi:hypothetical protein [Nocardioides alcanivorans]|uniref:hypothetical protein n=1 Tax=Nocardioides alcanivorans TaxID=2897352 RepID=UPI001F21E636|nr:hypothetical protein [Nocardioides alcanivorans]